MAPACRMKGVSLKAFPPWNLWDQGLIELSDSADDHIGVDNTLLAGGGRKTHPPKLLIFVKNSLCDSGLKGDLGSKIVFVGNPLKIIEQQGLRGVTQRPLIVWFERVGVEHAGGIDTATWVSIFEPGSTDVRVFFGNFKTDSCLLEPDSHQQARHAGSDDQDVHAAAQGRR